MTEPGFTWSCPRTSAPCRAWPRTARGRCRSLMLAPGRDADAADLARQRVGEQVAREVCRPGSRDSSGRVRMDCCRHASVMASLMSLAGGRLAAALSHDTVLSPNSFWPARSPTHEHALGVLLDVPLCTRSRSCGCSRRRRRMSRADEPLAAFLDTGLMRSRTFREADLVDLHSFWRKSTTFFASGVPAPTRFPA